MNQIIDIFYCHKERYGYRRITLELANRGYKVNHKKVKRLMSVVGLYGVTPKAKYKSYKGDMNGTVKNQLLTMSDILKQQDVMRNEQPMYLNFILQQGNSIYHRS